MDILAQYLLCLIPAGTATTVITAVAGILIRKIKKHLSNKDKEIKQAIERLNKILEENSQIKELNIKVLRENADLKKTLRHIKTEEDKVAYEKK